MSDELGELREAAPGAHLITDPGLMDSYRRDQTPVVTPGQPRCVLLADSTAQVAAALEWAEKYKVPVVPRGGGTSLAGGKGSMAGTLIGTLIMGILTNMLRLNNVDSNTEMMLKAVIIIAAVWIQQFDTARFGKGRST